MMRLLRWIVPDRLIFRLDPLPVALLYTLADIYDAGTQFLRAGAELGSQTARALLVRDYGIDR